MEFLFILLGSLFLILITPFLSFIGGWVVGWLIKVVFGTTFITGLSLLHINIDINMIPLLCGILNVIGMFFRQAPLVNASKNSKYLKFYNIILQRVKMINIIKLVLILIRIA